MFLTLQQNNEYFKLKFQNTKPLKKNCQVEAYLT